LRKETIPEEKRLWEYLRREKLGVKFRRQHALCAYIVDFCCIKRRLIIELDGSQHLDQRKYDEERTAQLESLGYRTLRFWNHEIMEEIERVLKTIKRGLE
jgi:very-short-patch-repair endonuclease